MFRWNIWAGYIILISENNFKLIMNKISLDFVKRIDLINIY